MHDETVSGEISGFAPASARRQHALEAKLLELISPSRAGEMSAELAARPHIAGTEPQARTRDAAIEWMQSWGLETETPTYEAYLPHPTIVQLERVTPAPKRFTLREYPDPNAPEAHDPEQWPAWVGYSGAGDVTAEVVYANYGRVQDLDELEARGASLAGKIALVRYGKIFRGNKVLNVQARGAVGCLMYSDPYDDGYFRGEEYPKGPMRPTDGIQRGSLNIGNGDLTQPRHAAASGQRLRPEDVAELPKIPAIPIAYGIAGELLKTLDGAEVTQEWQGALPFRYHIGPGPVMVRMRVEHDAEYRKIWNTVGRLVGSERPDEWVIIGAHRDAWCCGAVDNVSGVVSVLEAARVCALLAEQGYRPRRSLLFVTWDAEEWGKIGSTEWVAEHRQDVLERVVAYINQDVIACGDEFGTSACPSLALVLRDVMRFVPSPDFPDRSIDDVCREHDKTFTIPSPGGGSDHEPFVLHLGVPMCGYGFRGRWGLYHSAFDTTHWLRTQGDPGYRRHAAAATVTASLAMRLANAEIVPLNYVAYADVLSESIDTVQRQAGELLQDDTAPWDMLRERVAEFRASAEVCRAHCTPAAIEAADSTAVDRCNTALREVERTLVRPEGDRPDEYERNLIFGVDPQSGYDAWRLPGLMGAIRAGDVERLRAEMETLGRQIGEATHHLTTAGGAIAGAGESAQSAGQ